ncbi:MAG: hypothetical protein ABI416_10165, partial [Ginsengibacter sp.]
NDGERKYYRFLKPANNEFPYQLELFSRIPDLLDVNEGAHLTHIPVDADLSSLSAILMNKEYYDFTLAHCTLDDSLQSANMEALVCLKAKAFLDMNERKSKSDTVEEKQIKKHKGDIFRLSATIAANVAFELPESIQKDMQVFVEIIKNDLPGKSIFKEMGLGNINPEIILQQFVKSFQL